MYIRCKCTCVYVWYDWYVLSPYSTICIHLHPLARGSSTKYCSNWREKCWKQLNAGPLPGDLKIALSQMKPLNLQAQAAKDREEMGEENGSRQVIDVRCFEAVAVSRFGNRSIGWKPKVNRFIVSFQPQSFEISGADSAEAAAKHVAFFYEAVERPAFSRWWWKAATVEWDKDLGHAENRQWYAEIYLYKWIYLHLSTID